MCHGLMAAADSSTRELLHLGLIRAWAIRSPEAGRLCSCRRGAVEEDAHLGCVCGWRFEKAVWARQQHLIPDTQNPTYEILVLLRQYFEDLNQIISPKYPFHCLHVAV